ncbi:DUF3103 family protein [Vibrio metschnikovii]
MNDDDFVDVFYTIQQDKPYIDHPGTTITLLGHVRAFNHLPHSLISVFHFLKPKALLSVF